MRSIQDIFLFFRILPSLMVTERRHGEQFQTSKSADLDTGQDFRTIGVEHVPQFTLDRSKPSAKRKSRADSSEEMTAAS